MERAQAHFVEGGGHTRRIYHPAAEGAADYTQYFIGLDYSEPGGTYNIVVNGTTESQIDTTWGDSGFFGYYDGITGTVTPYSFLQLSDGSIIASFSRFDYDGSNYAYLCKISVDGTLDTSWGNNGFFTLPNATAYWITFSKILQDNDGNIYAFGSGGGSTSRGFVKIDSDGAFVKAIMSGSYTWIGAVDAVWYDDDKTKVMVISPSDYAIAKPGGGTVYPVNIMVIDLLTEARDTTFTGNVGLVGCADFGGGHKIRKLSDGDFVTFWNGSPTMQKFLSDGTALDTAWGSNGTLDIGTFAWSSLANRITIADDYIYCIANQTIEGTINNIIYKIDSTGTVETQYNVVSGSNSCYHCIQVLNEKLILGTNSAAPANYNIEFWNKDTLTYESGFDCLDGAKMPAVIYIIVPDEYTREGTEEYFTEEEIGYSHLEGETVGILADGVVYPDQVVTDGDIDNTAFSGASEVHIGLKYTSKLKPMKPLAQKEMMRKKATCKQMGISVHNTDDSNDRSEPIAGSGVLYGVHDDDMKQIDFNDPQWKNKCEIDGLFTGSVAVSVPDGFSVNMPLQIKTDSPLPCTVRAMIPKVDVTGA